MSIIQKHQFREFVGAVVSSLPDNLDSAIVQKWIDTPERLRGVLYKTFAGDGESADVLARTDTFCPISVNYGRSIEDWVEACQCDNSSSDITSEHFPTERQGIAEVVVEIVRFFQPISTEDALKEFARRGLRPAELKELLAFSEKHPNVQREFSILALGSVWKNQENRHLAPCLEGDPAWRSIGTRWLNGDTWEGGESDECPTRFAAVYSR